MSRFKLLDVHNDTIIAVSYSKLAIVRSDVVRMSSATATDVVAVYILVTNLEDVCMRL